MRGADAVILLLGGVALFALISKRDEAPAASGGTSVPPGTPPASQGGSGANVGEIIAGVGRGAASFIDALDNLFD